MEAFPFFQRAAACALLLCGLLLGCSDGSAGGGTGGGAGGGVQPDPLPEPIAHDLDAILKRDTLIVLTTYNSTTYFLYRGQPMGFEFELLQLFADDHDLNLRVKVVRNRDSLYTMLNRGEGDLVAARVVPMAEDTAHIAFTRPLYFTHPVLVQRTDPSQPSDLPTAVDTVVEEGAPAGSDEPLAEMAQDEPLPDSLQVRARLVRRPADLQGKAVSLPQESAYFETLAELSDTLTGDVTVVELEDVVSDENVIRKVASGDITFTVSPANVAALTESYFTNLYIRPVMGPRHEVTWAVRFNGPELRKALDVWISKQHGSRRFEELYRKYFIDRRGYRERVESKYLTSETGTLSDYDVLFRRFAAALGWDWRLLASQCYQESRFKPKARSWAGAAGLLQLMPATAREFGVKDSNDPEENVAGAARFLQWLTNYWDDIVPDTTERLKFILASYNTGHGHVEDARRLARKHGQADTVWADVAYWLLQKSKREVYEDPVVKYGYSRGIEPVLYVSHILERFEHYRQFVTGSPAAASRRGRPAPRPPAEG